MRRSAPVLLFLALSGVTPGCGERSVETIDLFPLAKFGVWSVERRDIPVDDEVVPEFGDGWVRSKNAPGGKHFRWASDDVSFLNLLVIEPRDLELRMDVRPFTWPGSPAQGLTLRVNGHQLGSWEIGSRTTLTIPIPASTLQPGENTVVYSWAFAQRVSEVLPRPGRQRRAAAVSELVIEGLADGAELGQRLSHRDGISLSPGSQLKLAVWTDEGAWLEVETSPDSEPGLQVWARREGEDLSKRWTSDGGGDARRIRFSDAEGPVEVVFRAPDSATRSTRKIVRAQVVRPSPAEAPQVSRAAEIAKPNVLLYVVDTLRADRLSCYGGQPGISPALERLAADGVLFERAVAQSSWTKPSMVSILSGLLTTEHGVRTREPRIPSEVTLVAELLRSAGYRTGAFTTNAYLVRAADFDRGFDFFEYKPVVSEIATRRALEWLDEAEDDAPFFLWIHTVDPHAAYDPEEPFRSQWAGGIAEGIGSLEHLRSLSKDPDRPPEEYRDDFLALYDAEIAQNDAALGFALDWLRERGRYRQTMVLFLSDHGEEFWEHEAFGHGWDLFEEVLHVPLVVKPAGDGPGGLQRGEVVEHIDLMPTMLAAAGLEIPAELRGRDLFADTPTDPDRVSFAELSNDGREGYSIRWRQFKLIVPLSRGFLPGPQLFDLERDAEERHPVTDREVTAEWLALEGRRAFALLDSAPGELASVELDEETRRGLEALGYLDPAGGEEPEMQ